MVSSFLTLPVELVYRIFDNLNDKTIFLSLINVCTRLNTIINTYHRYQVNFSFYIWSYFIIIFEKLFILKESHIRPSSLLFSLILDLIRKLVSIVFDHRYDNTSWSIRSHFLALIQYATVNSFWTEWKVTYFLTNLFGIIYRWFSPWIQIVSYQNNRLNTGHNYI